VQSGITWLQARAKPTLSVLATVMTVGKSCRSISTEPSPELLSTTQISNLSASLSAKIDRKAPANNFGVFQLTITIETLILLKNQP
jgi:hypothetical protein